MFQWECEVANVYVYCCLWLTGFALVTSTEQFREDKFRSPDENVDISCKSELLNKYQPQLVAKWLKDGYPVNETDRIAIDLGTNILKINTLQLPDRGLYLCLLVFLDASLVSNEVQLHMGPAHYTVGETDSWMWQITREVALPNVWSSSIALCTLLGLLWLLLIIGLEMARSHRRKRYYANQSLTTQAGG